MFLLIGIIHSVDTQSVLSPRQQEQVIQNVTIFSNDLNLSAQDRPAFRAIIEDFFIGVVALRAADFPVNTDRKIIRALINGRDGRAKDLLSSEQYKVYKAQIKKMQSNTQRFMKQQG